MEKNLTEAELKQQKQEEKERKAQEKAAAKAAKELEKQKKEEEKNRLNMLMSVTDFFKSIYDHISLALTTSVTNVYFQVKNNGEKEKTLFLMYEAFEFSMVYLVIKGFEGNIFYDWILDHDASFNMPISDIDIIRKFSKSLGKGTGTKFIPDEISGDENVFKLKYIAYENGEEKSARTIRITKGTRDYSKRYQSFVPAKFDESWNNVNWLLDEPILRIYVDDEKKISKTPTSNKLLEVAKKDILIEQKGEAEYGFFVTNPTPRGMRYIMLASTSADDKVAAMQVMKAITYDKKEEN